MFELEGDIWNWHKKGYLIGITTNGSVNRRGEAVMGRGVALQAKTKFPDLPREFGALLKLYGNVAWIFKKYRIFTIPVKRKWSDKADIELIKISLTRLIHILPHGERVCMVRPGCGNGGLDWKTVKPAIKPLLDDRFVIVERKT